MVSTDFKNELRKGWPIAPGITVPWQIRLDKTIQYGSPVVKKWKRWGETYDGLKEVTFTNVQWNTTQIIGLPSIHTCQLEYRYPPEIDPFKSINCYYRDSTLVLNELITNLGEPTSEREFYLDRDEIDVEYKLKVWKPFPDFPLYLSFHPKDVIRVWIEK